jgi:hypothetical protein
MVLRPGKPELHIPQDEEAGMMLLTQQQQRDEADQAAAAAAEACKGRLVSRMRYAVFNILYALGIWILVPLTGEGEMFNKVLLCNNSPSDFRSKSNGRSARIPTGVIHTPGACLGFNPKCLLMWHDHSSSCSKALFMQTKHAADALSMSHTAVPLAAYLFSLPCRCHVCDAAVWDCAGGHVLRRAAAAGGGAACCVHRYSGMPAQLAGTGQEVRQSCPNA